MTRHILSRKRSGLGSEFAMETETLAKFEAEGVPVHLFKLKGSELEARASHDAPLRSANHERAVVHAMSCSLAGAMPHPGFSLCQPGLPLCPMQVCHCVNPGPVAHAFFVIATEVSRMPTRNASWQISTAACHVGASSL